VATPYLAAVHRIQLLRSYHGLILHTTKGTSFPRPGSLQDLARRELDHPAKRANYERQANRRCTKNAARTSRRATATSAIVSTAPTSPLPTAMTTASSTNPMRISKAVRRTALIKASIPAPREFRYAACHSESGSSRGKRSPAQPGESERLRRRPWLPGEARVAAKSPTSSPAYSPELIQLLADVALRDWALSRRRPAPRMRTQERPGLARSNDHRGAMIPTDIGGNLTSA
jgi:hypothetical protein